MPDYAMHGSMPIVNWQRKMSDYCDWGIGVISGLNDEQMEQMLNNEFGGMNEVFADAYQISGDTKYSMRRSDFLINGCLRACVTEKIISTISTPTPRCRKLSAISV